MNKRLSWHIYGDGDKNIPAAAMAFMAERAGAQETVVVEGRVACADAVAAADAVAGDHQTRGDRQVDRGSVHEYVGQMRTGRPPRRRTRHSDRWRSPAAKLSRSRCSATVAQDAAVARRCRRPSRLRAVKGELPSFDGATAWLNSPPLTGAALRGKSS